MVEIPMAKDPGSVANPALGKQNLGKSQRTDPWWIQWISVAGGLAILGAYATWAVFQGPMNPQLPSESFYAPGTPYLFPFDSPSFMLWRNHPVFLPAGFLAPLFIVFFRGTCYYYRKAYYRAFFADPAGCAVGEARKGYCGETRFPFILQNLHRFFMVIALFFAAWLWADAIHAFNWNGHFGIGLGSLIMLANIILITGYTLGCHSIRHLVGGGMNCMSCSTVRKRAWSAASLFNAKHMQWAWASLISVCFADLYIRLVGLHIITDPRLLF